MRINLVRIRPLAYLLVAIATALSPSLAQADMPATKKNQAKFEVKWMKEMIDHHYTAVIIGELCWQRAVHPELVEMCQNMVASQEAEIEQMQAWLMDWYGVAYDPQMKPADERLFDRLAGLEDEELEIAFLKTMTRHHLQAISKGLLAVRRAYHDDLRQMTGEMVQAQFGELVQMREWLCEWYGICRGNPSRRG